MKVTSNKITTMISALTLLFAAGASNAATIAPGAVTPDPVVPDLFTVTISGSDFIDGTVGGGLSVNWNAGLLDLVSWDTSVFPGDQVLSTATPVLDQAGGSLSNLDVLSFNPIPGPAFDIVTLVFQAQASGVATISTALGQFDSGADNVWGDGFNDIMPIFGSVDVNVQPVPVPAAVWLFGSGLLGLVGVARRRRSA